MRIVIGEYQISLNEDVMRKTRRDVWVRGRLKALKWTGIDPVLLKERLIECFNLVRGREK